MSKDEDKKLQEAFDDVFRYYDYGSKVYVADDCGNFSHIGLRIYKTVLDDEGYKGMTDNIADNFEEIKFKDETLH